jgi:amino acid transporter
MLKDTSDAPKQPERSAAPVLRNEVLWFPPTLLLLSFQMLVLMRGLPQSLPFETHIAYLSSVVLVGLSLALMLLGIAREDINVRWLGLLLLVGGVAADVFVATSAATGSDPSGLMMALLLVTIWATVWSITGSQSGL